MGRNAKLPEERVRKNKTILIEWDGLTRGPELPLGLRGIKWTVRTLKWWSVWRDSAYAMFMTNIDWEFMFETALIHNEFWSPKKDAVTGKDGKIRRQIVSRSVMELTKLAGELRQRITYMERQVRSRLNDDEQIPRFGTLANVDQAIEAAEDEIDYFNDLKAESHKKQVQGE